MESIYKQQPGLFRLPVVAICEWLLVLPATGFLAAATLRLLQPREYEPARTSWVFFEWTLTHISRLGAATLFIGMPGVVVVAGCAGLLRSWRQDQALRHYVPMTLVILRRYFAIGLLTSVVLPAGASRSRNGVAGSQVSLPRHDATPDPDASFAEALRNPRRHRLPAGRWTASPGQ